MNTESRYELQKIDCNCNDCKFLIRDLEKYNQSKETHRVWQLNYFDTINRKKLESAEYWREIGEPEKAAALEKEVKNSKFMFNNDCHISFGQCTKFQKEISFIPNITQLETQGCFVHRKD